MEDTTKEQPAGSTTAAAGAQADSGKPEEKKSDETKPGDAGAKKDGQASKPGMKRVVRQGAGPRAPRDPNAPPPGPTGSPAKTIAMIACAVLFVACIGMAYYVFVVKPGKPPEPKATVELSKEAQELVAAAEEAEKLYGEAKPKLKSKEKADLQFAKERLEKAVALIMQVEESHKTVRGQEKLINQIVNLNGVIDKELSTVRKNLSDIEDQERIEKHRKDQANKPPEVAAPAAPTEPAKPGEDGTIPGTKGLKMRDFSKAVMDDLKEGNPSEFEFRTKLIEKLKIEVPKE